MTHDRLNFLLLEYNSLEQMFEQYPNIPKDIISQYYNDNKLADLMKKYDNNTYLKAINDTKKPKKKKKCST